MAEEPKIPALARRRKTRDELDAAKADRLAGKQAPLTFVIPPLATTLQNIQSVIATEVSFMQQEQRGLVRLDAQAAKKLQALTSALSQSLHTESELKQSQLDDMSDEELETALLAELEKLRTKRSETP